MKNKMYEMIIDDGTSVFKCTRLAKNIKNLRDIYGGNGEFVRVKEVTEKFPISTNDVFEALKNARFGDVEAQAVVDCLIKGYENAVD